MALGSSSKAGAETRGSEAVRDRLCAAGQSSREPGCRCDGYGE